MNKKKFVLIAGIVIFVVAAITIYGLQINNNTEVNYLDMEQVLSSIDDPYRKEVIKDFFYSPVLSSSGDVPDDSTEEDQNASMEDAEERMENAIRPLMDLSDEEFEIEVARMTKEAIDISIEDPSQKLMDWFKEKYVSKYWPEYK